MNAPRRNTGLVEQESGFVTAEKREICRSFMNLSPRRDKHGIYLISDALPFGRLWYDWARGCRERNRLCEVYSRAHHAVIRVYDESGNVIETHEHKGDFKEP